MDIDKRLLNFKEKVGSKISEIETFKSELNNDMNQLILINNNAVDQLNSSFKSSGGTSTTAQLEYINQTIVKINKSLDSELGGTITDCQQLNAQIGELQGILSNYNSKVSELNNMDEEDSRRGSVRNEINKLKTAFNDMNSKLCSVHDELLTRDSSATILDSFKKSDSNVDTGFTSVSNVSDTTASIYYEVDGVIYQKVLPYYLSNGGIGASYTIAYNKNAIINAVGTDSKIGQEAIAFLNSKLTNVSNSKATLWKMFGKSYSDEEYADIAAIMNTVLEGSYTANNCSSVSDYATIAAVVATNSLVHMKYDGARTSFTRGFNQVISSGYDCIGFTAWTYYQGLNKVYNLGDNADVGLSDVTCNGLYRNYGEKITNMSYEEVANVKPGSIVVRHGHIGVVVGTTKDSSGNSYIVIAHSSGSSTGTVTGTWPIDKLTNQWEKIITPEDMTKRAVEGNFKNA